MDAYAHLVFQRVPTQLYDLTQVTKAFKDENVPTTHIPAGRDPVKAFEKACSKVARSWKNQFSADGRKIRVSITAVESNDRYVQRDIVQETVQAKTGKDNYAQNAFVASVAKLIMRKDVIRHSKPDDKDRVKKALEVQMNGKTPAQLVKDGTWAPGIDYAGMVDEVISMTEDMSRNVVDDQAIRKTLLATLNGHCGATKYMDFRGVTIVSSDREPQMRALMRASNELGIMMHAVPLYADADGSDEMIEYLTQSFSEDMTVLREQMENEASFRRKDARSKMEREIKRSESLVKQYADVCPKDVNRQLNKELLKTKMSWDHAEKSLEVAKKRREAELIRKREAEKNVRKDDGRGLL